MELSWSSFILEFINFLVLVWILKRFFYAPLQKAINHRQQVIQDSLDKAQAMHEEANTLQIKYENRLKDWEIEKEQKRKCAQMELDEWTATEHLRFEKILEKESAKKQARDRQAISVVITENTKKAMQTAGLFVSKFLKTFASPDLEIKMIDKVIEDLPHLSQEQKILLQDAAMGGFPMIINSAYSLNAQQKERLITEIHRLVDKKIPVTFNQDPQLLAGLHINMGALSIQANLQNELAFFMDNDHE